MTREDFQRLKDDDLKVYAYLVYRFNQSLRDISFTRVKNESHKKIWKEPTHEYNDHEAQRMSNLKEMLKNRE